LPHSRTDGADADCALKQRTNTMKRAGFSF